MGITNNWSRADTRNMRAALAEASIAASEGEVPVGAVLVVNDEIISHGYNRSREDHDPSAHAEIVALRAAGKLLGNYRLPGATMYVTLEPCVMCTGALLQARVARVVFAAYDEKAGALGSVEDLPASRAFNHNFEVNGGLLKDESSLLLKQFFLARR